MTKEDDIKNVVEELKAILDEDNVPKNVKENVCSVIRTLENSDEVSIKVNKALNELEEVVDDINMQTFTRTQIWNIVSLLEKISQ